MSDAPSSSVTYRYCFLFLCRLVFSCASFSDVTRLWRKCSSTTHTRRRRQEKSTYFVFPFLHFRNDLCSFTCFLGKQSEKQDSMAGQKLILRFECAENFQNTVALEKSLNKCIFMKYVFSFSSPSLANWVAGLIGDRWKDTIGVFLCFPSKHVKLSGKGRLLL